MTENLKMRLGTLILSACASTALFLATACSPDASTPAGPDLSPAPNGPGDKSLCTIVSKCPKAPATSAEAKAKCEAFAVDNRCGAKFQKYMECALEQEKCNADGTYDSPGTKSAMTAACKPLLDDYAKCFASPTDGGTGGDAGTSTGKSGIFGDLELGE
jgi:hypothetical protein